MPPTDLQVPPAHAADTSAAKLRVWDLQPEVQHYRIATWDGIVDRGRADGLYDLTVLGTLAPDGSAVGGGKRAYFRSCPLTYFKRFGVGLSKWEGIAELVERERPDALVMDASPRCTDAWKLPLTCRRLGIPVLAWTKVHGYSKLSSLMRFAKPRFYSRYDAVICYGESSKRELLGIGYPVERIFVANNTIDTRRIFTQGDQIRARGQDLLRQHGLTGRHTLLCIGRMDPEKRHDDLLNAWPALKRRFPDLSLVIVGGGPMLEQVRARAAKVDREHILVTGRVPEGDDYAWISACDIGVYPGAVGLAINISLAFAKPTIIADEVGADTEILVHGQTGWRYPRGDLEALAASIDRIFKNPAEIAPIGERARALLRDVVTVDNMAEQVDRAVRYALRTRVP